VSSLADPSTALRFAQDDRVVIEFDQNGNSVNTGSTANYQIFPTYNVYVNGHLNNTIPQSAVASVIQLNGSSQLLPPPQ